MPNRMLNVNIVLAGALLFGLAGTLRPVVVSRMVTFALGVGLLLAYRSFVWSYLSRPNISVDTVVVMALAVLAIAVAGWFSHDRTAAGLVSPSGDADDHWADRGWLRLGIVGVFASAITLSTMDDGRRVHAPWNAWREDAVLKTASIGEGPLLTGGDLFLIQLRTRRPVLLDGMTLNTLPSALEAGPALDRILRDVYQVDLFNPPREAWGGGRVPRRANQKAWEAFDPARWQEIARQYGVRDILTPADWKLQLPQVAHSSEFELYRIVQ
jgi:hypothetical protein